MNRASILAEFRSVVDDTVAPYAWSDRRALHWLSEGQDKFCEETGYFTDTTTHKITIEAGVLSYALDSRVIEVYEVWNGSYLYPHWRGDRDTGKLTLLQELPAGTVLSLCVHRYSAAAFSTGGEAEIPPRFHLAMVEYAAHRAFGDHDRERQDPVKAKDHKDNFDDYCSDGRKAFARIESFQPQLVPNPNYVV